MEREGVSDREIEEIAGGREVWRWGGEALD